jgi:hypothetical protein
MTTLNTEELLSAALDADPGNHLLRYALADCLEESAGTVGCPECLGTGRINYGLADGDCGRCSGTGRVSDGRRERAEGYRVLAQLGLCPEPREGRWVWFGSSLGLRPGDLGVCAIGGGAEGWAVVHVGPRGDVADLGGDLYFGTHEEALSFAKELIDLWQAQQPGPSPE